MLLRLKLLRIRDRFCCFPLRHLANLLLYRHRSIKSLNSSKDQRFQLTDCKIFPLLAIQRIKLLAQALKLYHALMPAFQPASDSFCAAFSVSFCCHQAPSCLVSASSGQSACAWWWPLSTPWKNCICTAPTANNRRKKARASGPFAPSLHN